VEGNWKIRLIRWKTALILFISFTILPALASSEEIYKFERMWPTLQQRWYFSKPSDIAIDSSGYVYVVEWWNHRVQKFTADGQFLTGWGIEGAGDGEFDYPYGIAVDASGFVYVADGLNYRIQKFTADGQFVTKWGSKGGGDGEFGSGTAGYWPSGIAIDTSGNVYVADTGNHRIQKFDSDGQFIAKWGVFGNGEGQFYNPYGIAVDSTGFIYVADTKNHRLQKFSPDGQFVIQWGSEGSANGQFSSPEGIAVDSSGNVYVADTLNSRIQKFTADGTFVVAWGSYGNGEGEFDYPTGVTIDKYGYIHVADLSNNRIQKFTANGQFVTVWESGKIGGGWFNEPNGIALDGSGNVYVADKMNHRIQKFTADGQFILQWGSFGSVDGKFYHPSGIAVDSSGSVYVADSWNYRIQKFNSTGQFSGKWGSEGSGNGQFNRPQGIAVDSDGFIYVADTNNHRIQKFNAAGDWVDTWGTGSLGFGDDEFYYPHGIAVDNNGYVYVADTFSSHVKKLTSSGDFVSEWGAFSSGDGDGEFAFPDGITVDNSGSVYVADSLNNRIQKLDPDGNFITKWGDQGSNPGHMSRPFDLAVSTSGKVYLADTENNRIQIFHEATPGSNNKAVILAGGGPYPGNALWDDTQMCANFAYRALTYQGFTKETIYYLTSDTDLDLDSNGVLDDVDGDATSSNLEQAITTWATDADSLVIYLVDHGGNGTFRLSDTETLPAADLGSWLDQLQEVIPGKVIVVYDACKSGSFLSALEPSSGKERILITSTSPDEYAYFVSQGSISFSNYFWTHIFNGLNIKNGFDLASEAIGLTTEYQTPLLDDNGNGKGNEPEDGALAQTTFIGNGTQVSGEAPTIGSVSPNQTITGTSSALLYADNVTDVEGIARVWAVIRPPDYSQGSTDNPVQELPSSDLMPVGGDRYEGTYDAFNILGTYHIAIYARDRIGNTSIPKLTTVTVNDPLRRRAIIVAGGWQSDPLWPAIEKSATLVYEALTFQGYTDDDIYFMSPVTFSAGVDVSATLSNLNYAINTWARTSTQDVVLYLVGNGDHETFQISQTETLTATDLDSWLDSLQNDIPGKVTVIYDGCRSGSFLPLLTPPTGKQRISISSTPANQPAHFIADGDISFSRYFWTRILNGTNLYRAYDYAESAIRYATQKQTANIDDNGNGIANEKGDGLLASNYTIGFGIILAGDDPLIGSISPEQTLHGETSATIWVEQVTTTGTIDKVWALITPPGPSPGSPSDPVTDSPTVTLTPVGNGRYEGTYNDFSTFGIYNVAVSASDIDGNISVPMTTKVLQQVGPDVYEEDDGPSQANVIVLNDVEAQRHTFHDAGDQDWVMFYGLSGETYTIEVSNLGARCDAVIEFFRADGTTPVMDPVDGGWLGEDEVLDWLCDANGIYYVKVKHYDSDIFGEDTEYDLQVYMPIGPLPGFIVGTITNASSGNPIGGVRIKTDKKVSALSLPDGNYLMVHPPGSHSLTAEASGYENFTDTVTLGEAGTVTKNITMTPSDYRGDIDGDLDVDLTDAILAFQVMAGIQPSATIHKEADVNGDNRIGQEEAVYIMQEVAGLR
jgi:sugar lactone lactonase YvrE